MRFSFLFFWEIFKKYTDKKRKEFSSAYFSAFYSAMSSLFSLVNLVLYKVLYKVLKSMETSCEIWRRFCSALVLIFFKIFLENF